jgi:hypothetical protein
VGLGYQAFLFHDLSYTFTANTKSPTSSFLMDSKRSIAIIVVFLNKYNFLQQFLLILGI